MLSLLRCQLIKRPIRSDSVSPEIYYLFPAAARFLSAEVSKYRPDEFRVERSGEGWEKMSVISSAYISRIFCNDYVPQCAPQAIEKATPLLYSQ